MPSDAVRALGAHLSAFEAERLALALEAGDSVAAAIREVARSRRSLTRTLLDAADIGPHRLDASIAVLWAIAGARSVQTSIMPVWTMPGALAGQGRLTVQVLDAIEAARMSITCASFNFTKNSKMWTALKAASARPDTTVTVYLDARLGNAQAVADHLLGATVLATTPGLGAAPWVSHAKFLVVDRAIVLSTSANFSYSAENTNIEFGLLVHDTALAESIESTMRGLHGRLYQVVDRQPDP